MLGLVEWKENKKEMKILKFELKKIKRKKNL